MYFLLGSAGYGASGGVTPCNSLSLRLRGCWPSSEDDDDVVLKSSGAVVPLQFTSSYGIMPSVTETPPVTTAAVLGGAREGSPLGQALSEEESSVRVKDTERRNRRRKEERNVSNVFPLRMYYYQLANLTNKTKEKKLANK